jgi:secreted protein
VQFACPHALRCYTFPVLLPLLSLPAFRIKKILALFPALLLVGCSSTPADEEPNFTGTSPHSASSDSDALADAAPAKPSKLQKAEKDDDSALAAQVGGICGIRDYAQIIADDATDCAFALDIYKHAMDAPYRLETPDPTVTAAWQSDIAVKNPSSGESYDLHCIMATNQKSVHCSSQEDENIGTRIELTARPIFSERVHTEY